MKARTRPAMTEQMAAPKPDKTRPDVAKLTKAQELGVPVLDEAGFGHLIETGELPP